MTLADLSNLGSLFSALAVAGSLIYLGLQTHQAAKHTRALIAQGRATRAVDWSMRAADPDISAALIMSNGGTPTPEAVKQAQASAMFMAMFISADESFNQHQVGLLDDNQFGSSRDSYAVFLSQRGYRQAWGQWKTSHPDSNPKFIQFMDGLAAKPTAVLSGTPLD